MGRIRVLPPEVVQRIAAGEVVERPSSVVKELCDNALDAGARRVSVDVAAGGRAEIAVTDDGCGMDAAEARLAFARHATSKLARFEDLGGIRTLGFRGEALPSIAAVARVVMVTRPADAVAATVVRIEGGAAPEAAAGAGAPGTRVVVSDVFYNVPARRAALRAAAQELAAVSDVVTAAALARPDVAFRLRHEGREVLASPGDGDLLSAIVALWGAEAGRNMLSVRGQGGGWEVGGYCGTPAGARGNRGLQYLAVDGRPVRADGLRGAIEAAYRHHLMARRYPLFALRLRAEPGLYDANVHPSKAEVRIYRAEAVRDLCYHAVRAALAEARLVPDIPLGTGTPAGGDAPPGWTAPGPGPLARRWSGAEAAEARAAGAWWDEAAPGAEAPSPEPLPGGLGPEPAGFGRASAGAPGQDASAAGAASSFPLLRVVGQVAHAYLVAEADDGVYLVDQHAAHERIFFEDLAGRGAGPGQLLLEPAVVHLSGAQWERWSERSEALAGIGLSAEPFGDGTLLVRAVPAGLGADPAAALADLLEQMAPAGEAGLPAARIALAACKAAIKAGQPLGPADAATLLRELADCRDPFHCPHGRPTLLRIGWGALERHFGRR